MQPSSTVLVSQLLTVSKKHISKKVFTPESPVEPPGSLPTPFPTQPQQNTCNLNTLEVCLEWSKMEFTPPYICSCWPQNNNRIHTIHSTKNNGAPQTTWAGHISKVSPLSGACSIAHCVRQPLIRGTHLDVTTQLHYTLATTSCSPT